MAKDTAPRIEKKGILSFDYFLYNYGRYHNDKVNQILHLIFIPQIQGTLMFLLCHWWPWFEGFNPVPYTGPNMPYAGLFLGFVMLMNLVVDPVVGVTYMLWALPQYVLFVNLYLVKDTYSVELFGNEFTTMQCVVALHVCSWIA